MNPANPTRFLIFKGQFALDVYGASWALTDPAWMANPFNVKSKMGLSDNDEVLLTHFSDIDGEDPCPKFMIFVDESSKSIVLAIRGTFSLTDVIVDIICDDESFLDGFAHRGILRGATRIMKQGREVLQEALENYPGYRMVITGHSLGAGTAILITMGLLNNIYDLKVNEVKCVALAPPPVFRCKKKIPEKFTKNIHIFINGNDCVPRLTLANMALVIAMIRAIDDSELDAKDYLKILAGIEDEDVKTKLENLVTLITDVEQNEFPNLDHPGSIYYLKSNAEGTTMFKTSGQYFSKSLLLFDGMVLDHLQPYYEAAFANVKFEDNDENSKDKQ